MFEILCAFLYRLIKSKMGGACNSHGRDKGTFGIYRILIGTCEAMRPLGVLKHRREDNIKMGGFED
jgi:hypothetical protein